MSSMMLESSENFFSLTPRKRMRLPTFSHATNVTFQEHRVGREERASSIGRYPGFRGCTIWLTGLSGAGKTTISFHLEKTLIQLGVPAYGLDGDNVRHGLCKNLGFTQAERVENIRRVAEVSKLFADMGMIVLASFISPFRVDREEARRIHEQAGLKFFEVHVSTPLDVCEARDPKKLYEKARAGKLHGFTGIDSDYEAPKQPDLTLNAGVDSENDCVQQLLQFLYDKSILPEEAMHQLCVEPVTELFIEDATEAAALLERAADAPAIDLSLVDLQWLQVLAEGWASPLTGFMRERQYLQALHWNQVLDVKRDGDEKPATALSTSVNQSVPIVLAIDEATRARCVDARQVRLVYGGKTLAVMSDIEIYAHRRDERVRRQFACDDARHPAVRQVLDAGEWLVGGDVAVLERIRFGDGLDAYRKTPLELRAELAARGADCAFAFQLRNPVHNGHALLMRETRDALRTRYANPTLLLHPLGGWTKDDDVPLAVRIAQHEAVLDAGLLERASTILAIFPSPMLYAGPTEVQWHARARLAAGVTAYIVGRDPAGIAHPETNDYLYEPTHGAKVLEMAPGLGDLEIIPFRVAAYDKRAKTMSFFDATRKDDFEFISGTKMRALAKSGKLPPDGFMEPSAWKILADYYQTL